MQVRSLAELRSADAALFGGKSASLGELMAAGIPVPPGFALSSEASLDQAVDRYRELGEPPVAVRSSASRYIAACASATVAQLSF